MLSQSLTAAFAGHGVTRRNVRSSWSGRNEQTKTVAVSLWRDQIPEGQPFIFDSCSHAPWEVWGHRYGARERTENLAWAEDHCDGKFRVVIVTAKNTRAEPRATKRGAECSDIVMRITWLDRDTGEFTAEQV